MAPEKGPDLVGEIPAQIKDGRAEHHEANDGVQTVHLAPAVPGGKLGLLISRVSQRQQNPSDAYGHPEKERNDQRQPHTRSILLGAVA
jgi:hypothetical protein